MDVPPPAIISQDRDRSWCRDALDGFVRRHRVALESGADCTRPIAALMQTLERRLLGCRFKRGRDLPRTLDLIRGQIEKANTGAAFHFIDHGLTATRFEDNTTDLETRELCLVVHDALLDEPGQREIATRTVAGIASADREQHVAAMQLHFESCVDALTAHWTEAVELELPLGEGDQKEVVLHASTIWFVRTSENRDKTCWVFTLSESAGALRLVLTRLSREQTASLLGDRRR